MKILQYKTLLLAVMTLACTSASALTANNEGEEKNSNVEILPYWASNWGATTSFGAPKETRKINTSKLYYNYVFGVDLTKMITPRWGVTSGLRFERKANGSSVEMKNFLTTVTLAGAGTPTHGYFTGKNTSKNDNKYLTLPLLAVYRANKDWDFRMGAYFSYALSRCYTGEATDGKIRESPLVPATAVTYSTSDFSDDITKYDIGLQLGTVHRIWKELYVTMDVTWGLVNTLDSPRSGMTMNVYNLYYCMGLGWKF